MKAFLHAHSKHGSEYAETFSAFLVQAGADNYIELFMSALQNATETTPRFLAFIHEIHAFFSLSQTGRRAFQDSGVMIMLIDMST